MKRLFFIIIFIIICCNIFTKEKLDYEKFKSSYFHSSHNNSQTFGIVLHLYHNGIFTLDYITDNVKY